MFLFLLELRHGIYLRALLAICTSAPGRGDQSTVQSKSAAAEIEGILRRSGRRSAQIRFQEIRTRSIAEFSVDEREFNALGYKFLRQERKLPEAIAVFEMNRQDFPGPWNAWDSLGEAYYFAGNHDKAGSCYEKSLALNPKNLNARYNLSRIRGTRLDIKGETKEAVKFQHGVSTGIQGPLAGHGESCRAQSCLIPEGRKQRLIGMQMFVKKRRLHDEKDSRDFIPLPGHDGHGPCPGGL